MVVRGLGGPGGGEAQQAGPPPATVAAAMATRESWPVEITAIGTLRGENGLEVTPEIAGRVEQIVFDAGDQVEQGALLVMLDTSSEEASLSGLEAQLAQARVDAERAQRLFAQDATPEADYEAAQTLARDLAAQVEAQRTLIAKKNVPAPFAGKLGIRQISVGDLIAPGDPIVTLQSVSPILVDAPLPEEAFGRVEPGQSVSVSVGAYPDEMFAGEIVAIEPQVEEASRSFTIQAQIPNEDGRLQPGMFADVTVDLGGQREVVAIPETAVTFNAYGKSVFFVRDPEEVQQANQQEGSQQSEAAGGQQQSQQPQPEQPAPGADPAAGQPPQPPPKVAQRGFVETGARRGLMIEVTEGVEAGEQVVTAGQIKIDDGFPIVVSEDDELAGVDPQPQTP
jgi:membrane fusion protein (multidrug efflux system)